MCDSAEAVPANKTTYVNAADLAFNFIVNQLQDSNSLSLDTLNMQTCGVTSWYFTYNQGKFVEGAIVLYSQSAQQKYLDRGLATTVAAVKTSSNWQGANGLITEGQGGDVSKNDDGREFKGAFVCAVYRQGANGPVSYLVAFADGGEPSPVQRCRSTQASEGILEHPGAWYWPCMMR